MTSSKAFPGSRPRGILFALCAVLTAGLALSGCATSAKSGGEALRQATRPAWSLKLAPPHLVVAVSPVRQTLQIAGSIGTVIGAGITAVQNANYKDAIEEALGEYDTQEIIQAQTAEAVAAALGGKGKRVAHFDKGAVEGVSIREAAHLRYRQIAKAGHDQLLDIAITHGVYGVNGDLIVRLRAELHAVPSGRLLWKDTIAVRGGEVLAFRSLGDPTGQLMPNITSPRLSSKPTAISQWTEDEGQRFKTDFQRALAATLAGMQVSLGGADTADGLLALGTDLMFEKKFAEAHALLEKARLLAPDRLDIANTEAVNLGHGGQVDDAIALAEKVILVDDENATAHLNLAWWYGMVKKHPDLARPHYQHARKLGMGPVTKLEKALGPSSD